MSRKSGFYRLKLRLSNGYLITPLSMLRATLFYPVDSYPLDRRFIHWIGLIHWISYPPFEQPAPVCKYKVSVEGKFFDNFFVEIFSSIQFRISAFNNNSDMIADR